MDLSVMSCESIPSETKMALKYAGSNKDEIEKIFNYYRVENPDSLKLLAADFLISNMIFQYTLHGPAIDNLNKDYEFVYGVHRDKRDSTLILISNQSRSGDFIERIFTLDDSLNQVWW
ncbi:hypothetical protein [Arthrospiribacter ruber]|uniref:Uncharacterized protein n=1 Tax=Arthrospiribacter ruber TaxID=2487934 RepID=A0A951IWE7_9BACT|nr:hypothetical protein [Arthrospiribacter ruber]MBW3466966.1 hypothetical protein [Arthrospiribacter ruber]